MKICSICNQELPLDNFKFFDKKSYFSKICNECLSLRNNKKSNISNETKVCRKCGKELPLDSFKKYKDCNKRWANCYTCLGEIPPVKPGEFYRQWVESHPKNVALWLR